MTSHQKHLTDQINELRARKVKMIMNKLLVEEEIRVVSLQIGVLNERLEYAAKETKKQKAEGGHVHAPVRHKETN